MSLPQQPANSPPRPAWSFRIATILGIPIRIHFTFLLFLGWVAVEGSSNKGTLGTVFVVAIFVCVLLHELGHALVARKFSVQTRDITLYPIGGIAMLDSRPKPNEEFWIALAGPAVNVVLAIVLSIAIFVFEGGFGHFLDSNARTTLLDSVLFANIGLAIFNMIPAFPMDGGRVLRAALAQAMPETKATQIAGGIGQGLAILFGIAGIYYQQGIFILIAFFVFVGASQEVSAIVTRSFLHGHLIADAMQTRFRTILSGDNLERAANMLLDGSQHDFPVMNGDEILGVLMRNSIVQGLASDGPSAYVASRMTREFKTVEPDLPLEIAIEMFPQGDQTPIMVVKDERLVGMVTIENLSEFVMLEHAKSQRSHNQN